MPCPLSLASQTQVRGDSVEMSQKHNTLVLILDYLCNAML
jgi:hypothetical protein